ncbi:hypothetical protein RRG08_048286 [Elysia crispata]|uniref:Uncharacterized protein n=1 Tax=Elysia crispata TaxID=231223 RepID=A0AAE0ZUA9_9GAST|nr:hypothetical protein RRG08_048286 [Elysia crispata]
MTTTLLPMSYNESVRLALCSPMLVASDLMASQQQTSLDRPPHLAARRAPAHAGGLPVGWSVGHSVESGCQD